MKITDVEVRVLCYRYPEARRLVCAEGTLDSRLTNIIRVSTDEGLVGIGSVYSHPGLVRKIAEHISPFLVGERLTRPEDLWAKMYSLTRWYGRKGVAMSTLGGIDIALWDLVGKAAGVPLYKLLGGQSGEVATYASGLLWQDDLSQLVAEARDHLTRGFALMKMRIGRNKAYDKAAVESVAQVIGERAKLAVDGTHRYSVEAAQELGKVLREHKVAWFEEPFPPEDLESYMALRKLGAGVPIAAGENEFGLQGFHELLHARAVDIIQPDVSRTGGITEGVRIAALAAENGVPMYTHTWSDAVALTANAHLVAASRTGMGVECDTTRTPFMSELLAVPVQLGHGTLSLGDRPGLGIELDMDVVEGLDCHGEAVPDGNYADLVFGRQPYDAVDQFASEAYS